MANYELMGKEVQFDRVYQRTWNGGKRTYEERPWHLDKGWVVGFRTIYDGYVTCDRDEYGTRQSGNYFVPTGNKQCVLICVHPRQNPLKVPLGGIKGVL